MKFKTRSAVYLNRFELMTRAMMQQMQNAKSVPEFDVALKAGADGKPKESPAASGPPPLSSTSKDAGKQPPASKKKKGKKKK